MSDKATYQVVFPDGHKRDVSDPTGKMSETELFAKALQERAIDEGKIQTTWLGGAAKQLGQEKATNAAAIGSVGMMTGLAPVVAIAPLAADWIDYTTKKLTGEQAEVPSATQQGIDIALGAAGAYGPQMISKSGGAVAAEAAALKPNGVPAALARLFGKAAGEIAPQAEKVTPKAFGATIEELVTAGKQGSQRLIAGLTKDDVLLMQQQVAKGMKPLSAAKIIGGNDPQKIQALMKLYRQPIAGLKP